MLIAVLLTSCIFDSDDTVMSSWLSEQGIPSGYNVQTLSIENLTPLSYESYIDTTPILVNERASLGKSANIVHDLVFDIAFFDSLFFADLKKSDSASAYLALYILKPFYSSTSYPKDSFPLTEDLKLTIEWKIDKGSTKSFVDSVGSIEDSVWLQSLKKWKASASKDTTISLSISAKDTVLKIGMPEELLSDLKKLSKACRVQIRLSAPEAKRTYRFYGAGTIYYPKLWVTLPEFNSYDEYYSFRMSRIISNKESCTSNCAILHGGVYDSLVIEYESAPILNALSQFYGDEFPSVNDDGDDVRQTVLLAQMTYSRDDSYGESELGLPVQVVVGSYIDSSTVMVRKMEAYKLNKQLIIDKGHPNMVFYDGDSLTLQITYGIRDFLNRAKDGRTFKMMMRLGYPVLQAKDSVYADYKTSSGDSSYVFFSHFDHARYDFSSSMKAPSTLKLWLASKRGEDK